jgi:acetylornithine deacetylase/succinyl-diaminopimelate desuccinylase-like protein
MNKQELIDFVHRRWDESIVPELIEFIRIPNKSPAFDPAWQANGYMEQAVELVCSWCQKQAIHGLQLEVIRLPGRTPLIYMDIPGQSDKTILLYGHIDKQPEMDGWDADLGPWKPVLRDEKLYGRGGADDGYAGYAALTAIEALQRQNIAHARCVVILEASEESGSYDLPHYVEHLKDRIGSPDLVICLDSGCGNYEQLWLTTSLRGLIGGTLRVQVGTAGVHSGAAGGVLPSSFRIIRDLLERIENAKTGEVLLNELQVEIPRARKEQAEQAAEILGNEIYEAYAFAPGVKPASQVLAELALNRSWRPSLAITGADGLPNIANAGNTLRPYTALKLALRVPPTCNVKQAAVALKQTLESDQPYNAIVSFTLEPLGLGWHAPELQPWLAKACDEASIAFYAKPGAYLGEGGTIPFMGMLGDKFPKAQFMVVGVLGPQSNAHGPNEFLHIPMAKKLTCCVAQIITEHYRHNVEAN